MASKRNSRLDAILAELQKHTGELQKHTGAFNVVQNSLNAIQVDVEELKQDVRELRTRETSRHLDLDQRLRRLEKKLGVPSPPSFTSTPE